MKLKTLDGCAVPKRLYPVLRAIQERSGCTYNSVYRGDGAEAILNRHGKHTQRQLVNATPAQRAAWGIQGTPNPVGRSTHEMRSDGVAYAGPIGRKLEWYECGIDIEPEDVEDALEAADHFGWDLRRPYGTGIERHHCNFARKPRRWRIWWRKVFGEKPGKKRTRRRR